MGGWVGAGNGRGHYVPNNDGATDGRTDIRGPDFSPRKRERERAECPEEAAASLRVLKSDLRGGGSLLFPSSCFSLAATSYLPLLLFLLHPHFNKFSSSSFSPSALPLSSSSKRRSNPGSLPRFSFLVRAAPKRERVGRAGSPLLFLPLNELINRPT